MTERHHGSKMEEFTAGHSFGVLGDIVGVTLIVGWENVVKVFLGKEVMCLRRSLPPHSFMWG